MREMYCIKISMTYKGGIIFFFVIPVLVYIHIHNVCLNG